MRTSWRRCSISPPASPDSGGNADDTDQNHALRPARELMLVRKVLSGKRMNERRFMLRAMLVGALTAIGMCVAIAAWWFARQPTTIRMEDTPLGGIYQPATLTVRVGTTVQWKNDGQQVHDTTDRPDAALRASDVAYPSGASHLTQVRYNRARPLAIPSRSPAHTSTSVHLTSSAA